MRASVLRFRFRLLPHCSGACQFFSFYLCSQFLHEKNLFVFCFFVSLEEDNDDEAKSHPECLFREVVMNKGGNNGGNVRRKDVQEEMNDRMDC